MLTPILENLVVQGLAEVFQQTVGQNGVATINVPDGKSAVITSVNVQPFFSPQLRNGYGFDDTANKNFLWDSIDRYLNKGLTTGFNTNGDAYVIPGESGDPIIKQLLKRGIFQVELASIDKSSILTYANEYEPVLYSNTNAGDTLNHAVLMVPTITERRQDTYSIHKNNVHVRLRFLNDTTINDGFLEFGGSYTDITQSTKDVINTIPETAPFAGINSANMFFASVVFANTAQGKFGLFPFGVETNYSGASNLAQYNSRNSILFPYTDDTVTGINKFTGTNGELSLFQNANLGLFLKAYTQLMVPYINIQYVLINEKPEGNTLVPAARYNNVTVTK
jgi:hypothetical protein